MTSFRSGLVLTCTALAMAACSSAAEEPMGQSTQHLEELVVNGHSLTESEGRWLRFVASDVVPHLEGSQDDRLTVASRVAWWSLKEGVFGLDNPIVYSNCNSSSGDRRIGAFEACGEGRAWQVGLSGVQVTGRDVATLESRALALYPGRSANDVLRETARQAGVDESTTAQTTGSLRASWLLRNSAVGFSVQEPTVTAECIDASRSWCYGTAWDTTASYAPTRAGALTAIKDIRDALERLAGAGGADETCGNRARRVGWANAYCEQAGSSSAFSRVACNGTGSASSDCSRCCNADAVGPAHTDESCGDYAARVGFANPMCESSTNGACKGSGPSTGDGCLHCCDTP